MRTFRLETLKNRGFTSCEPLGQCGKGSPTPMSKYVKYVLMVSHAIQKVTSKYSWWFPSTCKGFATCGSFATSEWRRSFGKLQLDDSMTVLSISRSLLSWSDLNWFSKFFFSMGFGTFLSFIAPALPQKINQWRSKGHDVPPIFLCFTQKHFLKINHTGDWLTSLGNQAFSDFFWSTHERPAQSWRFRKSQQKHI